ncbi:hypothetical protein DERP_010877 [Dermatophagoides pteronyssinus]|uniref:Uncharacterized protein n=1 Tax=Dermatophagoides pteronyssinus TaxID=6956 RepID=A0ABQ8JV65_DERPT|nr:hypothetical protein DERP_010877 [Dermatophagoides pteronyssinus]
MLTIIVTNIMMIPLSLSLPLQSSSQTISKISKDDNRLFLSSSSLPSSAAASTTTTMITSEKPFCNIFQPCGWEVFRPEQFRKIPSYFVFSSCQCSIGQYCVHDTDDLSIYSFVYRCKSTQNNLINT